MGLLKDQLLHLLTFGNHQMVSKVNNTSFIHRETVGNSLRNFFLDPGDSCIMLLGFYDLILKGWFRRQN